MRTKLLKFTAVLGLMLASSNAFASFIYVDANGVWWECWYEDRYKPDGTVTSEVKCILLDHMPPIQP